MEKFKQPLTQDKRAIIIVKSMLHGSISFNWRSVMAPVWVFDYILVYEMVHMIERGHTDRFWHLVARVIPDYEEHVRWLNENGADLDL